MTEALTKDGEVKREIASLTSDVSTTAASAFNPLYGPSGSILYRCVLKDGGFVDVKAATGDEAATMAFNQRGSFVMSVNPAPKA